jgi:hypothetical protein
LFSSLPSVKPAVSQPETSEGAEDTPSSIPPENPSSHPPIFQSSHLDLRNPATNREPRGKVAHLPPAIRHQVCEWIAEGITLEEIAKNLADLGHPGFNHKNISNWKAAGYLHWLREHEWREEMQQTRAEAVEFIGADDAKLEQVTLKTASMRMYQLFKQFDTVDFSLSVRKNPEAYTRLFSALPRITREALRYQKYRDACAQARAELKKVYDPNRKLSDSERLAIVRHVDDILGIRPLPPDPKTQPLTKHDPGPAPAP